MIEALFFGLFTGIALSFGFGSVFFSLINDSIAYGYKAGVKIALGVVFGDILMVFIAYYGTSILPQIPNFSFYSRIIGAILLFGLGLSQFLHTSSNPNLLKFKVAGFFYFFVKGFLLNVINPVNFISWMVVSATLKSYRYDSLDESIFFTSSIGMIFLLESLFSFFSDKIKDKLSQKTIHVIKQISGIVFLGVGMKMLYDAYQI